MYVETPKEQKMTKSLFSRSFYALACLSLSFMGINAAFAEDSGDAEPQLRICTADEPPFTTKNADGFDDEIARIVAEEMGRKPVFVHSDRPGIYLVRDYLDEGKCDVVMGLDVGDPRVLTSQPYYRTGYVFVARSDRDLKIDSWDDDSLAELTNIALPLYSPPTEMLKAIGKYETNMNYMFSLVDFKQPRNQYVRVDPARMVNEVVREEADAAIAFAAEVARYVNNSSVPLDMYFVPEDTVPDAAGNTIEFNYSEAIAVRKDDTELLEEINAAIEKAMPRIIEVLEAEGIPLLPLDEA